MSSTVTKVTKRLELQDFCSKVTRKQGDTLQYFLLVRLSLHEICANSERCIQSCHSFSISLQIPSKGSFRLREKEDSSRGTKLNF